ncbi:MAG: DUF5063 domain-containing protein [Clostridiales bacterium]|nr:DUF5063 domain-containing protein [Clostridiales bacterium]
MNDTDDTTKILNTNSIAFIGLCHEYCSTLESARESEQEAFLESMVKLLPRLYISATDLNVTFIENDEPYLDNFLDEDYYESIRRDIEMLMGEHDVYLEVFEEDMKYSDTPVSASVSEGLADIFQVLYNFLNTIRDTTDEVTAMALLAVQDDFRGYWSAILCNVLRAVNHLRYQR